MGDTQPRRIAEQCNGRGSTAGRFRPTRLHSGGNVRRETLIRGASFTGTSDLTIVAPIRKGLVPALDAVTYKTRVQRVLKTLHLGRQTAHEYEFARILSDAVERVGRIHSIRIAIIEPEDKVMLAVTFDGSWESYIRVIWQKVSRSLDLIFCNTEGYVTGWDHTFEEWGAWLRWRQAQSSFLYSPPGLTYQDTQYLRMYERRLRGTVDPHDPDELAKADLATTRIRIPTAEEISAQLIQYGTDPTNLGLDQTLDEKEAGRPSFRQGMRGLAGLYRLAELHLPGTPDGDILHRAASELLSEFLPMIKYQDGREKYQEAIAFAELRFLDAMDWLAKTPAMERSFPVLPNTPDESEFDDVQGGIVQGYDGVSDGCMLLLGFDSALDLGAFLAKVEPTSAKASLEEGEIAVNIALTLQGLRLAGLTDDEVAELPEEFAQGMERRAGMLGDVRINHPRRWRLPALNWGQGIAASDVPEDAPCQRVDLSAVHLVVQLRICNSLLPQDAARTCLLSKYSSLVSGITAPRPLSIQWMHHLSAGAKKTREHFGFLDGQSQPVFRKSETGRKFPNQIHLGEVLLGHENAADPAPKQGTQSEMQRLLRNGSFLVVRKLRQDVGVLEQAVTSAAKDACPEDATGDALEERKLSLLGYMVGRWPIGHPKEGQALAEATQGNDNDFSFASDAEGTGCPFHAHIRRANPREIAKPAGARPARLMRRGMSYGPLHDPKETDEAKKAASLALERGIVFMAYNASIGEQFEVVQRWLTGGNSSGSYSGESDPLLGVAEPGRPRYFRFEDNNATVRVALDGSSRMHDEPRPFVRLEWGAYLFTPALSALKDLATRAMEHGHAFAKSWSVDKGEAEIARLRRVEAEQGETAAFYAWKAAIEDPTSSAEFTAASIWAALRKNHGGVLDTPFGVLVASRDLVDEVLNDRARNLTATGYLPRMHRSFGPLYLGLDAGHIDGTYERESVDVNAAIMGLVNTPAAFNSAVAEAASKTRETLDGLLKQAIDQAKSQNEAHWDVTFEAREIIDMVLAHFCEKWFGLSETGEFLKKSGMRWNWKPGEPPCYPGHFMAPSRYTFQPHPEPEVERVGSAHGLALRVAISNYLEAYGTELKQPVAYAAINCAAAKSDSTYPARTLAGVLMGFLPTTDGNIRRVLNEWLNEGTLWELRAQCSTSDSSDATAQAALRKRLQTEFIRAMQLRAAPELLWRTAAASHVIGKHPQRQVKVSPGQMVIASLISATQECLEKGDPELAYAFGGDRRDPAGHPTHACPGYGPAEAVMLGFFQGLVESKQPLRPGPAALSLSADGYIELPKPPQSDAPMPARARSGVVGPEATQSMAEFALFDFHPTGMNTVRLLAIGDSWLVKYFGGLSASLNSGLASLNYICDDKYAGTGRSLATMAQKVNPDPNDDPSEFALYLANIPAAKTPKAILIGGGGNDLVDPPKKPRESKLFKMLNSGATSAANALNDSEVSDFIDKVLKGHYRTILKAVTAATSLPVFIHAYDNPFADGEPFDAGHGPWLKPVFDALGIAEPLSDEIMALLIGRLNKMVDDVAKEFGDQVHPLSMNGELAKQADFPGNHRKYWANELHASKKGFEVLAQFVKAEMAKAGVK